MASPCPIFQAGSIRSSSLTPGWSTSPTIAASGPRDVTLRDNRRPQTRDRQAAAYSSRASRAYLRRRGIKAVIPEKADQAANRNKRGRDGGRPVAHDAEQYKERNTVERCINKIRAWRGLATRHDQTPPRHMARPPPRRAITPPA